MKKLALIKRVVLLVGAFAASPLAFSSPENAMQFQSTWTDWLGVAGLAFATIFALIVMAATTYILIVGSYRVTAKYVERFFK